MKKTFPSLPLFAGAFLFAGPFRAAAQDAAGAATANEVPAFLQQDTATYLLFFLFFILALTVYILYRSFSRLLRSMVPAPPVKKKEPAATAAPKEKKPGFWKRFDRQFLTKAVPVEREADVMLQHDYDGIRELDNKLPPWWVWGFYLTIFFAFVYLLHFHVSGTGKLSAAEYRAEMDLAAKQQAERMRLRADLVTPESVTLLTDAASLEAGKGIYTKNCVVCHLASGGGQVGPNLTDDYWIHGGGIRNLFKVITEGVPAKGMISWKSQLTPKQIQQVASYVTSLHGTHPEGGKEPQGDLWVPEPENAPAVTADTTVVAAGIQP